MRLINEIPDHTVWLKPLYFIEVYMFKKKTLLGLIKVWNIAKVNAGRLWSDYHCK